MLSEKVQRMRFTRLACNRGQSIAEVARQAVNLGLERLEDEDEFLRGKEAVRKRKALRERIYHRLGEAPRIDLNLLLSFAGIFATVSSIEKKLKPPSKSPLIYPFRFLKKSGNCINPHPTGLPGRSRNRPMKPCTPPRVKG
jgi:hypothetical protein